MMPIEGAPPVVMRRTESDVDELDVLAVERLSNPQHVRLCHRLCSRGVAGRAFPDSRQITIVPPKPKD
jgi:hypothetical protein